MKIHIERQSVSQFLLWIQRALFAVAIVTLGYCAYVFVDSWLFQKRENARLDESIAQRSEVSGQTSVESSSDQPAVRPFATTSPEATEGKLVGRISVKRLGVSVAVVEGAGEDDLRHAAGHITGTALPGDIGNVGIAAHRDTFFRPLRNIREDDLITLTTEQRDYRYRVVSTRVVKPSDVTVLKSDGHEELTLVTCYPFYYVGSAPNRFIVRAERIPDLVASSAE